MSLKFEKNARVCFVGDSITANGTFMGKIFDYYTTKYPELNVRMYNCGVPGDSATGCLPRLEDTVYRYNPTEIVLMFGMNDCRRFNFGLEDKIEAMRIASDARHKHFASMIKLCRDFREKGLPVTLCSATPYDEISDMECENFKGCNGELRHYFMTDKYILQGLGFSFKNIIDLNTPMTRLLCELKAMGAQSFIGPDRVHPTAYGHEVIARIFLASQGFNVEVPSAYEIAVKKPFFPDFSKENSARKGSEGVLTMLGFVDWNLSWNGDKFSMTVEQRCEHWNNRYEEMSQRGGIYKNSVDLYLTEKKNEKNWVSKYTRETEKYFEAMTKNI